MRKRLKFKTWCYAILVVAFLIFYQQSPAYALLIVGLGAGGFLLYKSKKNGSNGPVSVLFSGKQSQKSSEINNIAMALLLQQLLNSSQHAEPAQFSSIVKDPEEKNDLYTIKNEILEILDGELN